MTRETPEAGEGILASPGADEASEELALTLWKAGRPDEAIALLERQIAFRKAAPLGPSAPASAATREGPLPRPDPASAASAILPLPRASPSEISLPEEARSSENEMGTPTGEGARAGAAAEDDVRPAPVLGPLPEPRRAPWRGPARLAAISAGVGALLLAALFTWVLWGIPPVDSRRMASGQSGPVIEAADGTPLGSNGGTYAGPVTRAELPDHLVQAVLATEDRRFYDHMGVDPLGIVRAAWRNFRAGDVVEGGSTITQQLAKVLFLEPDQTIRRKLQEAVIATWLDLRLSKDEILTKYLDSIYLGSGATGVTAAARLYFGKPVSHLSLAESAVLAGLIRAPSRLNPLSHPEAARERAATVLDSMVEAGFASREEAVAATRDPASAVHAVEAGQLGGWFSDWVQAEAKAAMPPGPETTRIRTTLQPRLQAIAEDVVRNRLEHEGAARKVGQAALVALSPDGAVVAMVGGRDYKASQFNRAVQARRQPGSAFAVVVYLAALRLGWTLDDPILDAPVEIDGWTPENFPESYEGEVTVEQAFARSLNSPVVRLARDVGIDNVVKAARDLGIDAELPQDLTIALGSAELDLLDLTGAYAAIAAGRESLKPWAVAAASEGAGAETKGGESETRPLEHQDDLRRLLTAAVQEGTGRAAALEGFVAGKTGTSQNHRDGWFIGFTDELVAGVWVGNDDDSPMDEVTGGDLPAEIWREFVSEATGRKPVDLPPADPAPAEKPAVAVVPGAGDPAASEGLATADDGQDGSAGPSVQTAAVDPTAAEDSAAVAPRLPTPRPPDAGRSASVDPGTENADPAPAAEAVEAEPQENEPEISDALARRRADAERYAARRRAEAERSAARSGNVLRGRPERLSQPETRLPPADGPTILLGGRGLP